MTRQEARSKGEVIVTRFGLPDGDLAVITNASMVWNRRATLPDKPLQPPSVAAAIGQFQRTASAARG